MDTSQRASNVRTFRKLMNDHRRLLGLYGNVQRQLQSLMFETEVGGDVQIRRGQPASDHPHGEKRNYTVVDDNDDPVSGATVQDVINRSLVTFQSTAIYFLFQADGEWYAYPSQFDACRPSNPRLGT